LTVTPIFDDLVASRAAAVAPSVQGPTGPTRGPLRPGAVVGSAAFGRGCLESDVVAEGGPDDEVTRLLEGARREAVALGRPWVDSVHLLLAAVRAGGDVGRAFGMRGVGPAVLLAALADGGADTADDLVGGDPVRPALSSVARTVLHRVAHRAARADRAVTATELAVAVARTGRVADLLGRLGVSADDLDDLADALAATAPLPTPEVGTPPRRVPVPVGMVAPVGVVAPVAVMRPVPASVVGGDHAAGVPA
jgi:hypothetical protein